MCALFKLWHSKLACLPWSITKSSFDNVLLVLVKLLQSVLQILDRSIRVAVIVAAQAEKIQKATRCPQNSARDILMSSNDAKVNPSQVLGLFPRMLLESAIAISEMSETDERLQNLQPPVKFLRSEP